MSDSSLYWGRVTHHRFAPKVRRFSYRVVMFEVFLDEIDELVANNPRLRLEGAVTGTDVRTRASNLAPGNFVLRRRDFLPDYEGSLEQGARAMYLELTGEPVPGRIAMLTNLRSLGWNFNPITLYFFFDADHIVRTVAEVTNTPWNERHLYLLGPVGTTLFSKAHHVSPFLEMDGTYELTYSRPADTFTLSMTLFDLAREGHGPRRFCASMSLVRRRLSPPELDKAARSFPDMALRVSLRIYLQAARIVMKRIRYVPHPVVKSTGSDDVRSH